MGGVTITDTTITIPTYEIGAADKNPEFIEKRVYQGSSGRVYPYPVVETIGDEKRDKAYRAVILENDYLEVTVLPELGGRIQYARDKTNGYDFVYRNDVIKPALVGLTGPWISGGIEFNWPQHHRPTTYLPVDYRIEDLPDGGKAVQCHDTDQMYGTQAVTTIALHPGKAVIEISAQLYNGTALPQTFLWWANPAVPVNEHTKTVMPPDVTAVMDHGKRDVSRYPIATGTYYKHDYSEGVDIGRYKNVPVPTSYMAAHSEYDFVGGYDFGVGAGILHVADHHVSPGKKQWTWGNGDFGRAWDRNLTDANGPYVELMTGVFTDNQPDFTWLKPYEGKTFTQYFMPYKGVGLVKNATVDAAVNLEIGPEDTFGAAGETEGVEAQGLKAGQGRVTAYATGVFEGARVTVANRATGETLYSHTGVIGPNDVVRAEFETGGAPATDITVTVADEDGRVLVEYTPKPRRIEKLPEPAKAADEPERIATNEELLLAGLHLEQYRHATYMPDPYYLEGLKRDPGDARINNAYGRLLLRRGDFTGAERYFRAAIRRLTKHNTQPYDSEPHYNLGLALLYQGGRDGEAFDAFFKATWDDAQKERAFFAMAAVAARRGDYADALEYADASLTRNTMNVKARALRAYLLRKLGRARDAAAAIEENLKIDAFDFVSGNERVIAGADPAELEGLMRGFHENYLMAARDYALFGAYGEALALLAKADQTKPMVRYYEGHYLAQLGRDAEARAAFEAAEAAPSDYCFPNKLEDIAPLERAIATVNGPKAAYYLGCLYYDKTLADRAIALWERSRDLDPSFPTVHRNLALAYYNKRGDAERAQAEIEEAYRLDESDARVFLELDQLHRRIGWTYARRLAEFERHLDVVSARDDLFIEYLTVLNQTGNHARAYELMRRRRFHPWEGGEGKVTGQYRIALTLLAKDAMAAGEWEHARDLLTRALAYPHNLGEGKLEGQKDNDLHYWLGVVARHLGDGKAAEAELRRATIGPDEVKGAMYYNDQPAEMILFQGLAHAALGERGAANARFYRLLDYGEQHLDDRVRIDYFAVSLPDFLIFDNDYTKMNRVHCLYLMGLANIGTGDRAAASRLLAEALALDPSHIQANLFADELAHRHVL
ncbi:DUF5107 domain-containing protein [Bifidobacterium avesanii]|uniref:DUF5107 domain-containing protein n=2 Tax=Bifidobacterium avesanii TaxID=1798157 RepID=A0A7K3TJT9_9BIFI|nr:DUF5107 domain-containing protein [Bifidobacterium avesanii]KAB8290337.1 tetratricopeptide repeat protein [Bifidobacterium avesanii]NEG78989.1 DUF5107 domain-containing protein [Bifidobacterium avesanii]